MASIQTLGEIRMLQTGWSPGVTYTGLRLYDSFNYEYAALYRMQPNVRTCVDFLARNVAQLGLHLYKRIADDHRERLTDHPLARLLAQPLPPEFKMTRYRLIESLVSDLGVYHNAYWMKFRREGKLAALLRLPPVFVTVKGNNLVITGYELTVGGQLYTIDPSEVVHLRGYNPENTNSGLSPLETLRRVLAEEHAAGRFREGMWANAARIQGIVERPASAPKWSETARERFKGDFEEMYSGFDNSGKTAVLEEGMTWKPAAWNAQETEYLGGRKLTREECARAYHIPLPMVGILDNATFSNIREQHRNLYQDCLGPQLAMIESDLMLQLMPEFPDSEGLYLEFNILEKLQGSFEEQIQSLQSAVGRPWMTPNEARARMNFPPSKSPGADELATPLNVTVGGLASPRDTAPKAGLQAEQKRFDSTHPRLRERHQERWVEGLARHYRRQEAAIVSRIPKGRKVDVGGVWFDEERWNRELAADLLRLNDATAMAWAEVMLEQTGAEIEDMEAFEARMLPWLQEHSRIQAAYMNAQVRDGLEEALRQPDPLEAARTLFATAATVWAVRQALSSVTSASNFGANEGARASGLQFKTWQVNSSNPRPSHEAQNGVRVGIRETFPNGLRWPGDTRGSADETAGCTCGLVYS